MSSIQWGNVPDYFGGAAILAALFTWRRDVRRERREEERMRRGQAELVHVQAWPPWENLDEHLFRIVALNPSFQPIFNVEFAVAFPDLPDTVFEARFSQVGPGEHQIREVPLPTQGLRFGTEFWQIQFTDARGAKWSRNSQGELKIVPQMPKVGEPRMTKQAAE